MLICLHFYAMWNAVAMPVVLDPLADAAERSFDEFAMGINAPVLRTLVDYWNQCRGNNLLPSFQDFDPTSVPNALPYVWVVECQDLDALRHRLVGEQVQNSVGQPMVGRTTADLYPPDIVAAFRALAAAIRTLPCALHGITRAQASSAPSYRIVERVGLPFSSDGEGVDLILGATIELEADPASVLYSGELAGQVDLGGVHYCRIAPTEI